MKKEIEGYQTIEYDPTEITVPPFLPNNARVREGIAGYYQQISRLAFGVGQVLKSLEESGRASDTLVIFISDHGTSEPGAMGTHYEPGVRVPFLVRKPGLKQPGMTNQALVMVVLVIPVDV